MLVTSKNIIYTNIIEGIRMKKAFFVIGMLAVTQSSFGMLRTTARLLCAQSESIRHYSLQDPHYMWKDLNRISHNLKAQKPDLLQTHEQLAKEFKLIPNQLFEKPYTHGRWHLPPDYKDALNEWMKEDK